MSWGTVESESEVARWMEGLPVSLFATVVFYVELLAERGPLLGEPYTKQLRGKLRELRFYLDGQPMRITYWISSGRRIILLTVFSKSRNRDNLQVQRAYRAMVRCAAEAHGVEEEDDDV